MFNIRSLILLFIFSVLFSLSNIYAQKVRTVQKPTPVSTKKSTTPAKKYPKIKFDDLTFFADTITEGEQILHEFTFKNNGTAPLIIKEATATCGCTQPTYPFMPILPGNTGIIAVRYSSTGKSGIQNPTISVFSNATKEPVELTISTVVVEK